MRAAAAVVHRLSGRVRGLIARCGVGLLLRDLDLQIERLGVAFVAQEQQLAPVSDQHASIVRDDHGRSPWL